MPGLMEARIMEWEARVLERGREQGREQALAEMEQALEAGREGGEALTLMDARAMEWEARMLERGREQGIAQGREQGIAQGRAEERALLCRQAERRFGAETAGQISELLAEITGAEDLLEAGDWILECRTGGELLERLRHAHGK